MLRVFYASCIFQLVFSGGLMATEGLSSKNEAENCWIKAGIKYQVDPWLLYSIAEQESSLNTLAINDNRNGSRDVGLMQINSFWFTELEKYGISEQSLFDPCVNINVGAWILSQSIQVFGNNWRAVGAYNVGAGKNEKKEMLRQKYAESVYKRYLRLSNSRMFESTQP